MKQYDYLIIGSGFFGSICARELTDLGYNCLVLEKRNHIGGNCYTSNRDSIQVHDYGPHIFHTSNKKVWQYINKFAKFNNFFAAPVANFKGEIYSLPFNMWTFNKMWNVTTPKEAETIIAEQSKHINIPTNLEEQAIKTVGTDVYNKLIKGYVEKQWMKQATELPVEIIKRLPVRLTYDNNYYYDIYQGIPIGGYTQIFEKLLNGVKVKLNVDYLDNKEYWNSLANKVIFTGPIDKFYKYQFGQLEYKTTSFKHVRENTTNFQGTFMVSYTDIETPHTRIIEHRHFDKTDSTVSWITYEYPTPYNPNKNEPMYPVNDKINNEIYSKYKELANKEKNILFGGRLAEYKYYDMHQVIESALNFIQNINKK